MPQELPALLLGAGQRRLLLLNILFERGHWDYTTNLRGFPQILILRVLVLELDRRYLGGVNATIIFVEL